MLEEEAGSGGGAWWAVVRFVLDWRRGQDGVGRRKEVFKVVWVLSSSVIKAGIQFVKVIVVVSSVILIASIGPIHIIVVRRGIANWRRRKPPPLWSPRYQVVVALFIC